MGRSPGGRILLHRDNRVSFQRDAMWHFNALFQPAKCLLICKTRSRFELLLRRVSSTFTISLSLFTLSRRAATVRPSRFAVSSSLSPPASVFGILFLRSVAANPAFVSPCCRYSCGDGSLSPYLLKAVPSLGGTSRYGKRVYETLSPSFALWRPPDRDNTRVRLSRLTYVLSFLSRMNR